MRFLAILAFLSLPAEGTSSRTLCLALLEDLATVSQLSATRLGDEPAREAIGLFRDTLTRDQLAQLRLHLERPAHGIWLVTAPDALEQLRSIYLAEVERHEATEAWVRRFGVNTIKYTAVADLTLTVGGWAAGFPAPAILLANSATWAVAAVAHTIHSLMHINTIWEGGRLRRFVSGLQRQPADLWFHHSTVENTEVRVPLLGRIPKPADRLGIYQARVAIDVLWGTSPDGQPLALIFASGYHEFVGYQNQDRD